ncbi:unnamed protein product [Plutella xylostella]|uniref:tRNA pseudouridine(55) synthase n=1 Tax=Plutella xylostella TaxID=51655 RepID=A0A8S4G8W4_PLUXY|nr:unnamed protein product [Plutella xylostella]
MNEKDIFSFLIDGGYCTRCCFRYMGIKNPNAYENPKQYALQFQASSSEPTPSNEVQGNGSNGNGDNGEPPCKMKKSAICRSCLGILQDENWAEGFAQVKAVLEKKNYVCDTFACALSAPIATILRERLITTQLRQKFPEYNEKITPTALKEAWKWSFGTALAPEINKTLDSGAISPLLITVSMEYPDDLEELDPLKQVSPAHFSSRAQNKKRFTIDFTRRSVEQALDAASVEALQRRWADVPEVNIGAKCVSVACAHEPIVLQGRYIKLSRELPQSPWVLQGKRMMDTSVQEIIIEGINKILSPNQADESLKFIAAGREDVDVRCLGTGRPFAIEVSDPTRNPTETELQAICDSIAKDGRILVKNLVVGSKDDLTQLKQGEETKCKTYEALCIKLTHNKTEQTNGATDAPITVTQADIDKINSFSNVPDGELGRIDLLQKTPVRVLHRRPLLTRKRKILDLTASLVPGHPQLFLVRVRTEAGTYIKEWVHGEFGRTTPSLGDAIGAKVDIIALDVANVELEWPVVKKT